MSPQEVHAYLEQRGLSRGGVLVAFPLVRPETLVPICDDYLADKISADDLQQVADVLLNRPDHNWWREDYDPQYDYEDRVEKVLVEWHAPEVYFPMSKRNACLLRDYLLGAEWTPMWRFDENV